MHMMRTLLVSIFILGGTAAGWAQTFKKPECRCQNYGRYIQAGQVACIRTNRGPEMARCVMRGNVTDWDFLGEKCAFTSMTTIPKSSADKIAETSNLQ